MLNRLLVLGACLIALTIAASGAFAQSIGKVLVSAGTVSVERSGSLLPLIMGAPVESGDTVVTGRESHTQIRFVDESIIALRPDSRFRIDEFRFQGQQDGSETGFFTLLKGGMRKITGFIGKMNSSRYRLATAQATIGIRGTDYEIFLCEAGQCKSEDGNFFPDGFYCGVYEGAITATNQYGNSNWHVGRFFYIADASSPAVRLMEAPYFFASEFNANTSTKKNSDTATNAPADNNLGRAVGDASPFSLHYLQAENTSLREPQTALVGSDQYILEWGTQSFGTLGSSPSPLLTYDAQGGLTRFSNGNLNADRGTALLLDRGSATEAGNLNWGRWSGAGSSILQRFTDGTSIRNDGGNLHYIYGDAVRDLPTSGQVIYSPVGWTIPTNALSNQTGNVLSGGSITVDFTQASLNLNRLNVGFAGGNYMLSGGAYIVNGIFSSVAGPNPVTINCTGACQTTLSGTFGGFFAGRNGSGIGLDYNLNLSSALLEGVVAYRRAK